VDAAAAAAAPAAGAASIRARRPAAPAAAAEDFSDARGDRRHPEIALYGCAIAAEFRRVAIPGTRTTREKHTR
jgi:hypothetical protein